MSGEDWPNVMYDCMRSVGGAACIFFIALVVLGNFIMLNLFLAILLWKFEEVSSLLLKKEKIQKFYKIDSEA